MSANIYVAPAKPKTGKLLDTNTPSSFWDNLQEIAYDGDMEITLGIEHLTILKGLFLGSEDKGYQQIIDAIGIYESVVVTRVF